MGLDMYLEKRKKNTNDEWEELIYWRKANQIREWFVKNLDDGVENCKRCNVTEVNLCELHNICKDVIEDHKKAKELLPTSSGFFFGGMEYDEWYFDEVKSTMEDIKEVLENIDWETEEVSYYEWW